MSIIRVLLIVSAILASKSVWAQSSEYSVEYVQVRSNNPENQLLVGGVGGAVNYPQAGNVRAANRALGFQLGIQNFYGLKLMGEFMHSYQVIEVDRVTQVDEEQVDHYLISGSLQYDTVHFFQTDSPWSLHVGPVLTHSRRQYNFDSNSSQAWDVGGGAQLAWRVSPQFQLGLEYRFMSNMGYELDSNEDSTDRQLQRLKAKNQTDILETFNYQMVMMSVSILFDIVD